MSETKAIANPTRRSLLFGALTGTVAGWAPRAPEPLQLRRGTNLWPWFSLTREYPAPRIDYGWPPFQQHRPVPTRADLDRLARAGFDFVRLPVDPGPFLSFEGAKREALLADLDEALATIREVGLSVVLNLQANAATHHFRPEALYGSPDAPLLNGYRELVVELAKRLSHVGRAALEPVNEPPQVCGSDAWAALQHQLLSAARAAAPDLTLVATGACGGMIEGLTAFDPGPLAHLGPILFSLHFYEPYLFTHQGAPWMREPVYRALNAVPWPASAGSLDATLAAVRIRMREEADIPAAEREAAYRLTEQKLAEYFSARPDRALITHRFGMVAEWTTRNRIAPCNLLVGEFGALRSDLRYVAANDADRARYVRDVRECIEARGFSWAFWNLFDGFGLLDDARREPDPAILAALGLRG